MDKAQLYDQLRHRIEREDDLLNARTNIFLVLNGLTAVAVGIDSCMTIRLIISIVSWLANVLWLMSSIRSLQALKTLNHEIVTKIPDHPIEKIVQDAVGKNLWFRPSPILGLYLPILVTVAWMVAIVAIIFWEQIG